VGHLLTTLVARGMEPYLAHQRMLCKETKKIRQWLRVRKGIADVHRGQRYPKPLTIGY
jgi:hypothetical protein